MTESYWLSEPSEPIAAPLRDGRVDVAVVGAGVTGCAAALALAEGGLRVRLHDARRVAWGASGRNGGFALRGGALPYDVARRELGPDRAKELWRLSERYLDRMEELAGDALRRVGSLRLTDEEELAEVRAEFEALREDGFAAEWVDRFDPPLDDLYRGAIRHPTDGALQPARWVRRLAARAVGAGAEIVEESRVESLNELDADQVVIATDGYTRGLVPALDEVIRPVRGQVIVTEPLDRILFPCPHYARHGFDYWQQTPEGNLVLGGRRDVSLDHEYTGDEALTDAVQEALEGFAEQLLGEPPRVAHRWSGIFGAIDDRLPLAGKVPGRDGVWVAAGYSGHGNVLGLACGELVAGAILGRPAPELQLFDPGRLLRRV
ncbi:MAG: FAD-dependent oxidoreductase [Actinomycetota bacterium]